ncbi:trypco2 family protein [Nonomuraea sp. NPDC001023]|uniref:trypco2 family protein n=1 Tax=unclassified Nonomuraea TaxID=2593643 RepID=UPI00331FD080
MTDDQFADLSATIRQIRRELTRAMHEGEGQELLFGLGPVELEFLVDVKNEVSGEGGVKISVISVGAKKAKGRSDSHKIKLTLNPVDVDGNPARIAAMGKSSIPDS